MSKKTLDLLVFSVARITVSFMGNQLKYFYEGDINMCIMIGTKDELIKECTKSLEDRGYIVEKADIDHGHFCARCKSPKGQTVIMEMPVRMIIN